MHTRVEAGLPAKSLDERLSDLSLLSFLSLLEPIPLTSVCRRVKRPKRDYVYKRCATGRPQGGRKVFPSSCGSQSSRNVKLHSTTRKSFRVEGGRGYESSLQIGLQSERATDGINDVAESGEFGKIG